jgi:hypothetical protein
MSQQNQQQEQREIDRIEAAEAQQVADEAELEEKRKVCFRNSIVHKKLTLNLFLDSSSWFTL